MVKRQVLEDVRMTLFVLKGGLQKTTNRPPLFPEYETQPHWVFFTPFSALFRLGWHRQPYLPSSYWINRTPSVYCLHPPYRLGIFIGDLSTPKKITHSYTTNSPYTYKDHLEAD